MKWKAKKKKKKTILIVVITSLVVLLIVIGAIIGIVVYNKKKNKSQSEKKSDSKTELSEKEKEARQNYQTTFFKNNSEVFEQFEKEVENSVVNYQPHEEKFTPENYANWFRKVITEQLKDKIHPTFPQNVSEFEKNTSLKNPVGKKILEIIRVAAIPKKKNGKIDWIQALEVQKKFLAPFQKLETYQAVKSYVEKTLNPALTQNEVALATIFSERNLDKLNQSATERAVLVQVGEKLLALCSDQGSTHFPNKNFRGGFGGFWSRKIKKFSLSADFGSTNITEKFEFSSTWGQETTSPPQSPNQPGFPNKTPFSPPLPPQPTPPPPGLSPAEIEARKKCLEKKGLTDEKELLSQLSGINYQGDKFPNMTANLENYLDAYKSLMKQKQVNYFTTTPQSNGELYKGCSEIKDQKEKFVRLSLIPRKSNEDIDWIKYWEHLETFKFPSYTETEAENYLLNKVNPELQKWLKKSSNTPPNTDSEEAALLNRQLNKYIEANYEAFKLFLKVAGNNREKDKSWAVEYVLYKKFTGGKEVSLGKLTTCYLVPPPTS